MDYQKIFRNTELVNKPETKNFLGRLIQNTFWREKSIEKMKQLVFLAEKFNLAE